MLYLKKLNMLFLLYLTLGSFLFAYLFSRYVEDKKRILLKNITSEIKKTNDPYILKYKKSIEKDAPELILIEKKSQITVYLHDDVTTIDKTEPLVKGFKNIPQNIKQTNNCKFVIDNLNKDHKLFNIKNKIKNLQNKDFKIINMSNINKRHAYDNIVGDITLFESGPIEKLYAYGYGYNKIFKTIVLSNSKEKLLSDVTNNAKIGKRLFFLFGCFFGSLSISLLLSGINIL